MADNFLPRIPRSIGSRRSITIIASLYNEELVNSLIDSTNNELTRIMPNIAVSIYRVPGAFEIPVCAKFLLERSKPDAMIALGVIIKGATAHANLIASSTTRSLQDLALTYETPLIHEVLLTDNAEQAKQRCLGDKNRGVEAARAAITMAELFAQLKDSGSSAISRNHPKANG
ncbi:MAG: 6,7-dimethyl-8-ribityllumazine synthase [Verrucomicrobiales bacterium]|nr:6,7-dimethyl-8-ribityllumazine synthase [Verrucomicrobiales bacterium]MED5585435.1 6,7-dimethyl-8-ribityllumazine synthase [Verrucomicrobiota bacterium]